MDMTHINLIRRHSGFANIPDSFDLVQLGYEDRYDEYTETVAAYVLPAGYEVAKDQRGEHSIYDQRGQYCDIVEHRPTGRPQLVSVGKGGSDPQMPVLERVKQ